MDSFSLLTYNIHKGMAIGNLKSTLLGVKSALANLAPDLVFLQEVRGDHVSFKKEKSPETSGVSQASMLAKEIWSHSLYEKNATYERGHHGNAILSRYPFLGHQNINVSKMKRASRSLLHTKVYIFDTTIHLICVHLGLFKEERAEQISTLIQRIEMTIPDYAPLIIAGDFNDWQKAASGGKLLERHLGCHEAHFAANGYFAKSFPSIKPLLPVDRIYFRGLSLLNAKCLKGEPWHKLSDHLPLWARFCLN